MGGQEACVAIGERDLSHDSVVERYDVVGSGVDDDLQGLVDLVAQVCEVPMAAVNLLTHSEQRMIATSGVARSVCSREDSMCAVVEHERATVVVPDARLDPRFARNAFVTGERGDVRLYASAPLVSAEGVTVGRLCVFDDQPGELSSRQARAIATLATSVMDVLELRIRSRQLEESLATLTATRDELHRSNEDLTRFAHQVSHDLRSPLTALLANAEMLSDEPAISEDAYLGTMVDGLLRAGRRMDDLIGTILASAVEGGRLQLTDTDLATVFDRALADLDPAARAGGARVRLHDLPTVHADAELLYVVALNLLSNALKFARPEVCPEIDVHATRLEGRWRITVRDNGTGVDADRGEELFALYSRGSQGSQAVAGHGIGLATVRRIVEAHGGGVGFDPAESGAAVWFDLPR
jgi:signal transduction histidine kinase